MELYNERIKNLEYEVMDKIIFFLMGKENKKYIDVAKDVYNNMFNESDFNNKFEGFLMWLIWDYRLKDNLRIIEKFKSAIEEKLSGIEKTMFNSLLKGTFSVYRIIHDNGIVLKDLFTKAEIKIDNLSSYSELENNSIIFCRVYEFENNKFIFDDFIVVDKSFRTFIERKIYESFESYTLANGNITVSDFINNNSLLIYKLGQIIKNMLESQDNNEEYKVWQSIYVFKDKRAVLDKLLKSDYIIFEQEDKYETILKLYNLDKKTILAEIAIKNNKMEIECNNEKDIFESKDFLEKFLKDIEIKHFKDEVLTIEDLL